MTLYYASPTGLATNTGTIGSPWDLQTALNNASQVAGDTLYLRGGTYVGKFTSVLNGGTVRSYPGEWAVIDGYAATTLAVAITSTSQQSIALTSSAGRKIGQSIVIDGEMMQVGDDVTSNTIWVNRGWGGTTPTTHNVGATVYHVGAQLRAEGSNTVYRDFEIMSSWPVRDTQGNAYGNLASIRGTSLASFNGSGNSYINLVIHDSGEGPFMGSGTSNTLLYGCLIFNEGTFNPSAGHGMYLENASGYSRVYDTFALNNVNLGAQAYGVSGPYIGGDFNGFVTTGNGEPSKGNHPGLIYGPDKQQSPTGSVTNSVFYLPVDTYGYAVQFGYGAGVNQGIFSNNYILGKGLAFASAVEFQTVTALTGSGNVFDSSVIDSQYLLFFSGGHNWDHNTYYNTSPSNTSRLGQHGLNNGNFANWKSATGFDANSTINTGRIADTVILQPNVYESGRANIVIYCPSAPSSINVDLSTTGLVNGQAYTIKNAFNYNGSNVTSGTYNAASPVVSVPLTGAATTVATPVGADEVSFVTPATTAPYFFAMLVVPGAVNVSAPGQPTGLAATRISNTQINLAWTLADSLDTSVQLERSTDQLTWTPITLAAHTTSYSDTGRTIGTTYYYWVKAINGSGDSLYAVSTSRVATGEYHYGSAPTIS